ncbi:ABC transporter ATP-binding protein [Thermoflavimicrobium dichotomicum]|uniref:Putative ABC transport system ATP-binding protein/putative ABC transport system ATP-binding protein n=1 Tax=Thermoflavimicrobium dichotomicum TaxID=46223 RepID=A0A1I3LVD4_9BACL|nr:ABC transporter ATP-binding protein [Thermoflavimicrobium dichotomicum]SFI88520.1 putative ABC transport system ATP-binding protein/putative ABC transport system ATP-binding protein [Thermoflavimicrobium dichotomicum]
MIILEAKNLSKIYGQKSKGVTYQALTDLYLTIHQGEFVGIMGPSGSGKTTLLQILGTIDRPTSGEIWIEGQNVANMSDDELADFRRKRLGFIFQEFYLLDALTLKENILVPLVLEKRPIAEMEQRVNELAKYLGIDQVLSHRPYEVSGGQRQRAAAARALVHSPALILADEPTGNLDSKSAKSLMESLVQLNKKEQSTILTVTHDPFTASYCDRVIFIKDGKVFTEIRRGESRQAFFQQIMQVTTALGGESYELAKSRF